MIKPKPAMTVENTAVLQVPESQDTVVETTPPVVTPAEELEDDFTGPVGNSGGNLANDGIATMQDGWIYFVNIGDKQNLYKMKPDGSQTTKISDDICINNINVVGDWIYCSDNIGFSGIHRIRIDGTNSTTLNSVHTSSLLVIGNWIYYINHDDNRLYRIKTDESKITRISDDVFSEFRIVNDWIYYVNGSDQNSIYKVKIDGSNKTKIGDCRATYINIVGDLIFYANAGDGQELHRIKVDGTESKVYTPMDKWPTQPKVSKDKALQIVSQYLENNYNGYKDNYFLTDKDFISDTTDDALKNYDDGKYILCIDGINEMEGKRYYSISLYKKGVAGISSQRGIKEFCVDMDTGEAYEQEVTGDLSLLE